MPDSVFMSEVIKGGEAILDFAALELSTTGRHGALTHFLHDLVADEALKDVGGAVTYRRMMGQVQQVQQMLGLPNIPDPEFLSTDRYGLGTILWVGTYDRIRSLARPEELWPPLRAILDLAPKEL